MKSFKKSVLAVATLAALSVAGSANAYLSNWYLDTNGAAVGGGVVVSSLGLNGSALVTNSFTGPNSFSFNEAGKFTSALANNGTLLLPNFLYADFVGSGSGTVGATGGTLTFAPLVSNLSLYNSSNALIGSFTLLSGSSTLGANSVVPNDSVSMVFKATWLQSNYFFKDSSKAVDLASIVADPEGLLFGFATTNATPLTGQDAVDAVVANQALYTSSFGAPFDPTNNPGTNTLVLGNAGQWRYEIPEPASLALVGLGLLGAGVVRRRKVVAN